jgi:two-component system CheB/CheR fusion protein
MPYRTHENRINGVVITFADITVAKNLEVALLKAQSNLEKRFTHQTTELGKSRKNLQIEIKRRPGTKTVGGRTSGSASASKKPR